MNEIPIITTSNLTRRFGDVVAVDGLTLEVNAGEVFGFLGHNGAGKTTTVRLLNGVLELDGGSIRVLGMDPLTDGPALRARTGVLTESAAMDARLTGRDNLLIYADLFSVPRARVSSRVDELLAFFGLDEHADARVATYSTGMRQRLSLARTLLHEPEILFLDEPTAGLDPLAAHKVSEHIISLSREGGRTVFLCTHNLVEAQKLCDRVAVLEYGRLVALGTPSELAQQYIRRLDVNVKIAPEQVGRAVRNLSGSSLIQGIPRFSDGGLSMTVTSREAIPDVLALLVNQGIRVYRLAPQEPSLEDVYFALHDEKETVQ